MIKHFGAWTLFAIAASYCLGTLLGWSHVGPIFPLWLLVAWQREGVANRRDALAAAAQAAAADEHAEQLAAAVAEQEQHDAQLRQMEEQLETWRERAKQADAQVQEAEKALIALRSRVETLQSQTALDREQATEMVQLRDERTRLSAQIAALADGLVGQVTVALSEAEEAFTSVIAAFGKIAAEAQQAAGTARGMATEQNSNSVTHIAGEAATIMNSFVQRMLATAAETSAASRRLMQMTTAIADLTNLLDEVESVADQTAVLALNASIEAARAGQAGLGFAVVAAEVRRLSDRSRHAAEVMRNLTQTITCESDTVYKQLAHAADNSQEESSEARDGVSILLKRIGEADAQTRDTVADLSAQSDSISKQIERIIIAFQFHDLLRQRLEHVADPLAALRDELRCADQGWATGVMTGTDVLPLRQRPVEKAISVGAPPPLELVSYGNDAEDNVTLF